MSERRRRVPILLWPFHALLRLVAFILAATGRVIGALLGVVLMAVGLLLSATVVGAVLGVPIALLGFLLLLRSVF